MNPIYEIGSEYNITSTEITLNEQSDKNVFSYLSEFNSAFFDSGRSALRSIVDVLRPRRVLLPDYICESVRNCFENTEIVYYRVNSLFQIEWGDLTEKCRLGIDVLFVHYFNGHISEEYDFDYILSLKKELRFYIIEDTTHSFLSCKRTIGDYCICSLRKWFPIADGGVLYSYEKLYNNGNGVSVWAFSKRLAMCKKTKYLMDGSISKEVYLDAFREAERCLDDQVEVYEMSNESKSTLQKIDIDEVREIRLRNYTWLKKGLGKLGYKVVADNGLNQVPLFCVLSVDGRDALRQYLGDKKIYCPVHWPLFRELKSFPSSNENNAKELSIPIDQRYTVTDMEYVCESIREYNSK